MIEAKELQRAYQMIKASKGVLIIGHLRPDGDALSSISALPLIAERSGEKTIAFAEGSHPKTFNYLPGFNTILSSVDMLKEKYGKVFFWREVFNLIIVVDCGSLIRTGLSKEILEFQSGGGKVIEFDHHPRIDEYADLELRDSKLSSTAELIYNFTVINNIKLDKNLADCILTGIMSDTGKLLYPSASQATMKASSAALAAGARYAKILQAVSGDKSLAVMRLWGLVLDRVQLNSNYQMAIALVTRKDINDIFPGDQLKTALESELFSDLISFLSNYTGVRAVMLLYEDGRGYVKGSLRSTADGYFVDKLARALGGGGHERASGFAVLGKLENKQDIWRVT